jgi:hypothetical protein
VLLQKNEYNEKTTKMVSFVRVRHYIDLLSAAAMVDERCS